MKAAGTLFALLLAASTALAQEDTSRPDYSRDGLIKFFANEDLVFERDEPPVRYHAGAVEFTALGTEWRFNYLPIMAPFVGARPSVTNEWPDAFSLLRVPIATPRRAWRTQREFNAELRRINRKVKAEVRVETK
jgi:hypothetical protein